VKAVCAAACSQVLGQITQLLARAHTAFTPAEVRMGGA